MVAAVLISLLAAAPHAATELDTAKAWADLVRQHEPGALDDALFAIAQWPADDLEAALRGLQAYVKRNFPGSPETLNHLLKRGALLHSDVAMLVPERARQFQGLPSWPAESAVIARDGQSLGSQAPTGHWRLARTLLDRVAPNPARDETVRAWYVAVAAFLQGWRQHSVSLVHLDHARRLLRSDADIWFYSGVMHETFASAALQEAAATSTRKTTIQTRRSELDQAARDLRLVVTAAPEHVEARLRLGRVLHLLGNQEASAAHLRAALAGADDVLLTYYGELFLGATQQALGRRAAARECFERAAALRPDAQSPLVGLSHLARLGGNRKAAVGFIERIASLSPDPAEREDPWWDYDLAPSRHVDQLLERLRAPFLSERLP